MAAILDSAGLESSVGPLKLFERTVKRTGQQVREGRRGEMTLDIGGQRVLPFGSTRASLFQDHKPVGPGHFPGGSVKGQ